MAASGDAGSAVAPASGAEEQVPGRPLISPVESGRAAAQRRAASSLDPPCP